MNIILEGAERAASNMHTNVDKETTAYRTRQTTDKVETGGIALDISERVMDNNAYAGHGRTAEEVMLEAGQEDISARRNYMAVMSNSMSDEDFSRLQEEGFHPGSTDIETVVTIVDHIKAELLKSGTNIVGYTDDISSEALQNIAGSEAFARELQEQFRKHDIPETCENINAVYDGWMRLNQVKELSDGAVKYMVENDMKATPENLYLAQFSATDSADKQGKGYYAAGNVSGYYVQKPQTMDIQKLLPQIKNVIKEAGYEETTENIENAKWLVEKGIPLNADTLTLMNQISDLAIPVSPDQYIHAAVNAIAEGKKPLEADLVKKESLYAEAEELMQTVENLPPETTDHILVKDLPLTLRNLIMAKDEMTENQSDNPENISGRRLLEEVRLSMTIDANLKLLRSGYQIDTAPLEDLIKKLKQAESSYQMALTGESDKAVAKEKASLYSETLLTLDQVKHAPAAILVQISSEDTLREIAETGTNKALTYERVGQSYESLMTAPRADLGDSIKKAFQNVDDILAELNLANSEVNQKAVRILGYNHVEINQKNIEEIKEKDALLTGVVEAMKPADVLNMIREGINPVTMTLEELDTYLKQHTDVSQDMESYSKFLYQLEKQKDITGEERSAYIGVYRLIRQIEKGDDATLGAIWQTGAEFTLENLLAADRSSKHKKMDYVIDDSFGGIQTKETGTKSITEQLAQIFSNDPLSNMDTMKEFLKQADNEEAVEEYDRMLFQEVRTAVKSEEAIWQQLSDYQMPVTAENLVAASNLMNNAKEMWKETEKHISNDKEKESSDQETEQLSDTLGEEGQKIVDALASKETTFQVYSQFIELVQDALENTAFTQTTQALDIKAMSNLYKQMSFMGAMAKDENYEIPVSIDGQVTSINLKIIHSEGNESKATISFNSELFGKTAAEFQMTNNKVKGYCICNSEESKTFLQENQSVLEEKMAKEDVELTDIYFATSKKLNLTEFSTKETENRKSGNEAEKLYRSAKAFIGFVQEMGIKKGNQEYEN